MSQLPVAVFGWFCRVCFGMHLHKHKNANSTFICESYQIGLSHHRIFSVRTFISLSISCRLPISPPPPHDRLCLHMVAFPVCSPGHWSMDVMFIPVSGGSQPAPSALDILSV